MNTQDIQNLEKIVELEGDCLMAGVCGDCLFRKDCLPSFVREKKARLTKAERLHRALDRIANTILLDDE